MTTLYGILGVILQIAGFVYLCRVGARLADRLYPKSKWTAVAISGGILAAMLVVVFAFNPPFNFVLQTFGFWLIAFAGGIIVRMRWLLEKR